MGKLTFDQLPSALEILIEKVDEISRKLDIGGTADRIVDAKGAKEITKLSVSTIYKLVSNMDIPHMKRGGRTLFSEQELIDWVKESRVKTNAEIKQEAFNNSRMKPKNFPR